MAATREQTFVMDRIALVGPDELQITGGWHGIDREYLQQAELIIHREDGVTSVGPLAGSLDGGVERWSARFPLGDPDASKLQLRLGDALTVDLPWSGRGGRRFGRVRLPVHTAGEDVSPADAGASPREPAEPRRQSSPDPAELAEGSLVPVDEGDDLVTLHVALLTLREQLAEAEQELATSRAAAARAEEDTARAQKAREADAARAREALASLRAVAEEAVKHEHAKLEAATREHAGIIGERDAAVEEVAALRQSLEASEEQRQQLAKRSRSELDSAQANATSLEEDLAKEKERNSVLAIALSSARDDTNRLAQTETELERVQAELGESRTRWRSAEEEAARLRQELGAARAAATEADAEIRRLAAALHDHDEQLKAERTRAADAARAADRAARDAAELERQRDGARGELQRAAEAAKRSEAMAAGVPGLEQELERTRRELTGTRQRAEQLANRMQAVRAALQEDD